MLSQTKANIVLSDTISHIVCVIFPPCVNPDDDNAVQRYTMRKLNAIPQMNWSLTHTWTNRRQPVTREKMTEQYKIQVGNVKHVCCSSLPFGTLYGATVRASSK
jgi:hypothetical protein